MCANIHVNLCVLGANLHVNVRVRDWIWLNVRESTSESVCFGRTSICENGCSRVDLVECARIYMCICVFGCMDLVECARIYM